MIIDNTPSMPIDLKQSLQEQAKTADKIQVVIGSGVKAIIVDSIGPSFCAKRAIEYCCQEGASLMLFSERTGCLNELSYETITFYLAQNSTVQSVHLLAGVNLQQTVISSAEGVGAAASISVVPILWDEQKLSLLLTQNHSASQTSSIVNLYGAISGKAQLHENAKTDIGAQLKEICAKQKSSIMMLSPQARVLTSPQLAVQSRQISATHGAAVGSFDSSILYYAQLRGIPLQVAKSIYLQGFLLQWADDAYRNEIYALAKRSISQALNQIS